MKKYIVILLSTIIALSISGCAVTPQIEPNTIKVGVTSGPHATILYAVKQVAEQDGLTIEVVELDGYTAPNDALQLGQIDVNSFQNKNYLESVKQNKNYDFTPIAKTIVFPMGLYANKIKSIQDIPNNARVAIPNDHINSGRALVLLEKAGLIRLRPGLDGYHVNVEDIIDNRKNITIQEFDTEQVAENIKEFDLAAVTSSYAQKYGLSPSKDSLLLEDADSPYAHLLVVRSKDKNNPLIAKLINAYHSDDVKKYINEQFKGSILPAW